MRLSKLTLRGYGRFRQESSLNLDADVVALVGPNEAGKSTVLRGLASLGSEEPIPANEISRRTPDPADCAISATFLLTQDERNSCASIENDEEPPRWYVRSKPGKGQQEVRLLPNPRRPRQPRRDLLVHLPTAFGLPEMQPWLDENLSWASAQGATNEPIRDALLRLQKILIEDQASFDPATMNLIDALAGAVDYAPDAGTSDEDESTADGDTDAGAIDEQGSPQDRFYSADLLATAGRLDDLLTALRASEARKHPTSALKELLFEAEPDILLFAEADRDLASEYDAAAWEDPPPALRNVLELAEVDVAHIRKTLRESLHGERAAAQDRANAILKQKFQDSWHQSDARVYLQFDETSIRVHVTSRDGYYPIRERSDGLRAFVALYTFVASRQTKQVSPILLIDEAETHLHYDAQGDFVQVLETQREASQVIYTTHSAGCLPSDLGTGVRIIEPLLADGVDTGESLMRNSFWQHRAGFSPLHLAMGASAFAAVQRRRAIIAEGIADVILLPVLLKAATGEPPAFQVAPGLAVLDPARVAELDLEAPRVCYLVDGDKSGKEIRRKLVRGGVSESRIVALEGGYTPEDYVRAEAFLEAVNEELRRSFGDASERIELSDVPSAGRAAALESWCRERRLRPPSRRSIAALVAAQEHPLADGAEAALRALLERIERGLDAR